mmetsp:Transcript_4651/g.8750  ORF Transcript_4651/g.8750 Transcript_4651/m.8750 type:complete len:421 (-) Transcript_4651:484-1746(-)
MSVIGVSVQVSFLVIFSLIVLSMGQVPDTSLAWSKLKPESSIWTGRNAHGSCVYNGKMYVIGGHTDAYPTYDLQLNDKTADVWWTEDGVSWNRNLLMEGDFFAQNHDVVQPGPIAPFYPRYGHSLDPYDIDKDGGDDIMILMGGFAPNTVNDIWVTEDSNTWFYVGEAPWSPRAWHATVTFNQTLYLMGGTPLNREVWYIKSVKLKTDRPAPLTRAMFMDYTYEVEWGQLEEAPWSPRAGMGLINQPYTGTLSAQTERVVMIGGYGGWLSTDERFDGIRCQSDVWVTFDLMNWTRIADSTALGGLAWFGFSVWSPDETDADHTLWVVGGGYIGDEGNKKVSVMQGSVNSYYSKDAVNWVRTNYVLGGGTTALEQYSSNEWTTTIIDGNLMFLGLWGLTLETFQIWVIESCLSVMFLDVYC